LDTKSPCCDGYYRRRKDELTIFPKLWRVRIC
jgi:hypothetical protein